MLEVSAVALLGRPQGESDDPIHELLRSNEVVRARREAYDRIIHGERWSLGKRSASINPTVSQASQAVDRDRNDQRHAAHRSVVRDRLLNLLRQHAGRPPANPLLDAVGTGEVSSAISDGDEAAPAASENLIALAGVDPPSGSGASAGSAATFAAPNAATATGAATVQTPSPSSSGGGGGGGENLRAATTPAGEPVTVEPLPSSSQPPSDATDPASPLDGSPVADSPVADPASTDDTNRVPADAGADPGDPPPPPPPPVATAPPTDVAIDPAPSSFTLTQHGGSPQNAGSFRPQTHHNRTFDAVVEGDSFLTEIRQTVTVPQNPKRLTFAFEAKFDPDSVGRINDAFEVALLDDDGYSVVPTFDTDRDSFFNLTEQADATAAGHLTVRQSPDGAAPADPAPWVTGTVFHERTDDGTEDNFRSGRVALDIDHLTPGRELTFVARLINNDNDTDTNGDGRNDNDTDSWFRLIGLGLPDPSSGSLTPITEEDVNNAGDTVADFLFASDPNLDASLGIAITAVDVLPGLLPHSTYPFINPPTGFRYSTDNGSSWQPVGPVAADSALVLRPTDRLRYLPNRYHGGTATFNFHLWDADQTASGNKLDPAGDPDSFSAGTALGSIDVEPDNDIPAEINHPYAPDFASATGMLEDAGPTPINYFGQFRDLDNPLTPLSRVIVHDAVIPDVGRVILLGDGGQPDIELVDDDVVDADDVPRVRFVPEPHWNGTTSVGVTIIDNGLHAPPLNTGHWRTSHTIHVHAVNDEPAGADNLAIELAPGTPHTFDRSDFGFTDPVEGHNFAAVYLRSEPDPAEGTLEIDGAAFTLDPTDEANNRVTVEAIDAGRLVFRPAAGAAGGSVGRFTFAVQEDGGVDTDRNPFPGGPLFGVGVDTDQTPNAISFATFPEPSSGSLTPITEEDVSNVGDTVADFLFASDPNLDASLGIAITAVDVLPGLLPAVFGPPVPTPTGFQYSSDGGTSWLSTSSVAVNAALVLRPTDRLRYLPNRYHGGEPEFLFHLWQPDGTPSGTLLDPTDGADGFSRLTAAGSVEVLAINDAPGWHTYPGVWSYSQTKMNEDDAPGIVQSLGVFRDVDNPNTPLSHIIFHGPVEVPGGGRFTLHGDPVMVDQIIGKDDIDSVRFEVEPNWNGHVPFEITVVDDGGTANGGRDSWRRPQSVTVNAVNDEPVGADRTVDLGRDEVYIFIAEDFGFLDPIEGHDFLSIYVRSLPTQAEGQLLLDGIPVEEDQEITRLSIDAGQLSFQPAAGVVGVSVGSFTFAVRDDGGTLISQRPWPTGPRPGGQDTDQSPNTLSFKINAPPEAAFPPADGHRRSGVERDADRRAAAVHHRCRWRPDRDHIGDRPATGRHLRRGQRRVRRRVRSACLRRQSSRRQRDVHRSTAGRAIVGVVRLDRHQPAAGGRGGSV